ncbi:unnamed protein product [Sphenostylis stenocarpa]|uniref:Uncharacterized protein n=1 Tax=Sphenostylis stenocarpa TaxID=92480 RepID=A0AA87BAH4_9FABA|nr:unnamed protein product [Sphenostylis stenocarpa]
MAECTENSGEATVENVDVETVVEGSVVAEEGTGLVEENVKDHNKPISQNSNLSEWEARRYGTMTARILRDTEEQDIEYAPTEHSRYNSEVAVSALLNNGVSFHKNIKLIS